MSIKYFGRATRSFIIGTKLCPPAKSLASSPYCLRSEIASLIELAFRYSNAAGYIAASILKHFDKPKSNLSSTFSWEQCLFLQIVIAHRIPLVGANIVVGFFDE